MYYKILWKDGTYVVCGMTCFDEYDYDASLLVDHRFDDKETANIAASLLSRAGYDVGYANYVLGKLL